MGMPRSGLASSLNMGEWSTGLCISLRPNASSCKESSPTREFSTLGAGSSADDMEIVFDELNCTEADKESKSSCLANYSQAWVSPICSTMSSGVRGMRKGCSKFRGFWRRLASTRSLAFSFPRVYVSGMLHCRHRSNRSPSHPPPKSFCPFVVLSLAKDQRQGQSHHLCGRRTRLPTPRALCCVCLVHFTYAPSLDRT